MWIASLHASDSSVEEGLQAFQTISRRIGGVDSNAAMIRHYAGPIVDIFRHGRGSILRQMETASGSQENERWLQLTRWQIRADGTADGNRFEHTVSTLSPLIAPLIDDFEPHVFLAVDPGDGTLALAGKFASSESMEEAWHALRRPGPLRDALERHLILTEFVAGAVIDLFALSDGADRPVVNTVSLLATE
jgi:hypothetical protein